MKAREQPCHWVKPGMKLIDVCETLENSVRQLIEERGMEVRMMVFFFPPPWFFLFFFPDV